MTENSNQLRTDRDKGQRLAQRLSSILALLHQGDRIDKHSLAQHFEVNVRTIERDLNERLYGIAERDIDGNWRLCHSARSTIPANSLHRYARMAGTNELFPDAGLGYLLKQLDVPEQKRSVHVQSHSYEDLRPQTELFARLQKAIDECLKCRFTYKNKPRTVEPYKLIHKEGVWYLAAIDDGKLKNFSVSLIQSFETDEDQKFITQKKHHEYINKKEDIWFTSETTEVTLRADAEIAHYFTRRDLLPQQQNRLNADGSLTITAHISHENQLFPVVLYWLPNLIIIQPENWHKILKTKLEQALNKLNK